MRNLSVTALAAVLLAVPAAPASAFDPLEGLWGTSGGMKIEAQPDGALRATIIRGGFECAPSGRPGFLKPLIGRESFTVRPAGPSLYTGTWQLYDTVTCAPVGRGAARVSLTGDTFRLCASVDPAVAVQLDGSDQPVWPTVCDTSSRSAPPAPPAGIGDAVRPLPAAHRCRSRRHFRIRLRNPAQDPLVSAEVRVNGRPLVMRQGERATAPVDLRGLPRGRYAVTVRVVTATGRTLTETRRYRTCARKAPR